MTMPTLSADGGPLCSCGGDYSVPDSPEADYRETCDRHGDTPTARAWQARFNSDPGEEAPF